jgi:hypothetical protein
MASQIQRPAKAAQELARRRGIYLLPNLFTTLNLFAGFYAIVQGMNHDFEKAAVAIFVAMVLDTIDGRVARLTRTQSAFGAEYDSLSDMVSFGAGSLHSSTALERRCGSRASTRSFPPRTSAGSRACRAPPRPRWWPE